MRRVRCVRAGDRFASIEEDDVHPEMIRLRVSNEAGNITDFLHFTRKTFPFLIFFREIFAFRIEDVLRPVHPIFTVILFASSLISRMAAPRATSLKISAAAALFHRLPDR